MSKARAAAFHALHAIGSSQVDMPTALSRSRESLSDERDRALAMEIVAGTLRWQRSLDFLIEHVADRQLARIDADIAIILRLSLYQLLHLDRVPAAAIVNEAVELTRMVRKPGASGFVNGVLRNTVRQRNRLPLPPRPEAPTSREAALAYLGITHSHPAWLVARWLDRFGFDETERWVRFNNDAAPLTLRANRLRTSREQVQAALASEDIEVEPTAYAPDGLRVTSGNPLRRPTDGTFVVQDEASQLVALAVGARPGETVLDLCAAPGGKTTALAADMRDEGVIVACDARARRMRLLRDTVSASGVRHVRLVQVDSRGALPFRGTFDRVLVDAPCSGLGTIRRDPDIRWRRTEQQLPEFASRQRVLLGRAGDAVRENGRLIYATCSSEPEENEAVVDAFLADRPDFRRVDLGPELDAALRPLIDGSGALRTSPAHGLEAFFATALTRIRRDT